MCPADTKRGGKERLAPVFRQRYIRNGLDGGNNR